MAMLGRGECKCKEDSRVDGPPDDDDAVPVSDRSCTYDMVLDGSATELGYDTDPS